MKVLVSGEKGQIRKVKAIRKILSLVVVAVMVLSVNGFALVVAYDEASVVNVDEFTDAKAHILNQIDKYNKNLDKNIDKNVKKYKASLDVGGSQSMFDKIYPVGTIIVASLKPTMGTWTEVLASTYNRALWFKSGTAWGTNIAENWPKPNIAANTSSDGAHSHTFTGTQANLSATMPAHSGPAAMKTYSVLPNQVFKGGGSYGNYYYNAVNFNIKSTSAGDHNHSIKPAGSISGHSAHGHTVTENDNYYKATSGSVGAEPNKVFIKIWRRTA